MASLFRSVIDSANAPAKLLDDMEDMLETAGKIHCALNADLISLIHNRCLLEMGLGGEGKPGEQHLTPEIRWARREYARANPMALGNLEEETAQNNEEGMGGGERQERTALKAQRALELLAVAWIAYESAVNKVKVEAESLNASSKESSTNATDETGDVQRTHSKSEEGVEDGGASQSDVEVSSQASAESPGDLAPASTSDPEPALPEPGKSSSNSGADVDPSSMKSESGDPGVEATKSGSPVAKVELGEATALQGKDGDQAVEAVATMAESASTAVAQQSMKAVPAERVGGEDKESMSERAQKLLVLAVEAARWLGHVESAWVVLELKGYQNRFTEKLSRAKYLRELVQHAFLLELNEQGGIKHQEEEASWIARVASSPRFVQELEKLKERHLKEGQTVARSGKKVSLERSDSVNELEMLESVPGGHGVGPTSVVNQAVLQKHFKQWAASEDFKRMFDPLWQAHNPSDLKPRHFRGSKSPADKRAESAKKRAAHAEKPPAKSPKPKTDTVFGGNVWSSLKT